MGPARRDEKNKKKKKKLDRLCERIRSTIDDRENFASQTSCGLRISRPETARQERFHPERYYGCNLNRFNESRAVHVFEIFSVFRGQNIRSMFYYRIRANTVFTRKCRRPFEKEVLFRNDSSADTSKDGSIRQTGVYCPGAVGFCFPNGVVKSRGRPSRTSENPGSARTGSKTNNEQTTDIR